MSEDDTEARRFELDLFIVHPSLDPAAIASALGLEGHHVHAVGEPRRTPRGTSLEGRYRDTRWRHCVCHTVHSQHFAPALASFVESLKPQKRFLTDLRASGGTAHVIIQFLGDGYFGDDIALETLRTLVELDLNLSIECFVVPQNS